MSSSNFTLAQLEADIAKKSAFVEPLLTEIGKSIVGQRKLLEALLIGLLCRGHGCFTLPSPRLDRSSIPHLDNRFLSNNLKL